MAPEERNLLYKPRNDTPMAAIEDRLTELLEPTVEAMGYELVCVEFQRHSGNILRLYIDHPDGISLDDCATVSHQASGILDVEDPITAEYNLEVSSPGVDRPLRKPEHYQRFAGEQAELRLFAPVNGRRKLLGILEGLQEQNVVLQAEDETYHVPLNQIASAKLIGAIDFESVNEG